MTSDNKLHPKDVNVSFSDVLRLPMWVYDTLQNMSHKWMSLKKQGESNI